jgi:hypothetical protein
MGSNRFTRIMVAFVVANAIAAAIAWACGPFINPIDTVTAIDPADSKAFYGGEIGVIRSRFRRANLAFAYRVLSGRSRISAAVPASYAFGGPSSEGVWREERDRVLGPQPALATPRRRRIRDYMTPPNCLEDAFRTAIVTLGAREKLYGAGTAQVRDWVRAQDAVFANCEEEELSLPAPVPASADALARADRNYQMAAAYFYGMRFEEAATRFRTIANDTTSPWRPYGRYLAARSLIRTHTLSGFTDKVPSTSLEDAERELQAVIADPVAAPVHASAHGLLRFVRLRLRPHEELRAVSAQIAAGDVTACCAFDDFTYLMNERVGDTVDYRYDAVTTPELRETHDLVDWVLAMQAEGDQARDRAISRWRNTKSMPWLVAALARVTGPHAQADALLDAASAVPASSPAFASVNFYRVRLLIDLGRQDAARQVLSMLPEEPRPGVPIETINLYRAQRFMLARSFDELLHTAARVSVSRWESVPQHDVFDEDAGIVFDRQLTLDRLVAAAESTVLPERLRTRVTTAAFTRAVLLNRHDRALVVAPILRLLRPRLAADLDRYVNAAGADDRQRAAVMMILRTPGMTRDVRGIDDTYSVDFEEPRRVFENFVPVWWCAGEQREWSRKHRVEESHLMHVLYTAQPVQSPLFMTPTERAAVVQEHADLDRAGDATRFLATAALEWARQRPTDPEAAEALSRIVNGWRRACRDATDADLSRRAFQVLHRQFPDSEWAKRTKYWYR